MRRQTELDASCDGFLSTVFGTLPRFCSSIHLGNLDRSKRPMMTIEE